MTEQLASAESIAQDIDALCEQRVSAETKRLVEIIKAIAKLYVDETEFDTGWRMACERIMLHIQHPATAAAQWQATLGAEQAAILNFVVDGQIGDDPSERADEIEALKNEIAALQTQVNFFQVQYQDEIGLNGMREERDFALQACQEQRHRAQDAEAANMALLARYERAMAVVEAARKQMTSERFTYAAEKELRDALTAFDATNTKE